MASPGMIPRTEPFPMLSPRGDSSSSSSSQQEFSFRSASPSSSTTAAPIAPAQAKPLKSILKKRANDPHISRTFQEHAGAAGTVDDLTKSTSQLIATGKDAPSQARTRPRSGSNVSSILKSVFKRRDSSAQDNGRSKRIKLDHNPISKVKQVKKKAQDLKQILKADAPRRRLYEARHKLAFEEKLEQHRRAHPDERPDFQKRYLVEKQKKLFPGTAYEYLQGPRDFPVVVAEYQAEQRQNHSMQRRYVDSVMEGLPMLEMPAIGAMPSLALDAEERLRARVDGRGEDSLAEDSGMSDYKGISTGRKAAMGLSKMLDPFKRRGESSPDAQIYLGMIDPAPDGTMECCVECGISTRSFLVHGMCEGCSNQSSSHEWML